MIALDGGDPSVAEEHARAAGSIYMRLSDPWGEVETRLLLAQIALDRGDADDARDHLIACEAVALIEAEPKQHRHLTLAWLAYHEGRFNDAARELDAARRRVQGRGPHRRSHAAAPRAFRANGLAEAGEHAHPRLAQSHPSHRDLTSKRRAGRAHAGWRARCCFLHRRKRSER